MRAIKDGQINYEILSDELEDSLKTIIKSGDFKLYEMMAYHLGWNTTTKPKSAIHIKRNHGLTTLKSSEAIGLSEAMIPSGAGHDAAIFSSQGIPTGMIFVRNEAKVPNLETNTITVTEVRMSQDLKIAKAYVLPLGGKDADEIISVLKEYSFLIRKILSQKVVMKFLPKLLFRKDESFEYAEKIENLIKQTNK